MFSTKPEAEAALRAMSENKTIKSVLGKEPGGIHVMFANETGKIRPMSK